MYKAIVRYKVQGLFDQINKGNWQAMVDMLAKPFNYRFIGDTPLGGTRSQTQSMQLWWQRIFELLPDAKFSPQEIVVQGMPWNTRVMTYVHIEGMVPTQDDPDKKRYYQNEFMQLMHLRWGKIRSVVTLEDTQRFVNLLPALQKAGIIAASAASISDA